MNEASRIAVLETNYRHLLTKSDEHEDRDEDRFDRMFKAITIMKQELLESIGNSEDRLTEKIADLNDRFDSKVNPMWDERNQRKGFMKFSGFMGHTVTAIISVITALGIKRIW